MSVRFLKYCGNRSYEDYSLVRDSQATHIGFIFVEGSKRRVLPEAVAGWVDNRPAKKGQKLVGIVVNSSIEQIREMLNMVCLDVLQLHGTESPSFIKEVRSFYDGEIWKAIHHSEEALQVMSSYKGLVDAFLVDSKVAGQWGGTGTSFDWGFVPRYLSEAHNLGVPCFIAGGVSPDNIDALLALEPDGIDLASGIEVDAQKSLERIHALERKVVPK